MIVSSIQEIIAEIKAGRMVILVDEENRENEGDLVMAADFITPAAINFMATHGRGLICLTLTEERCRQLNLPLMVAANRSPLGVRESLGVMVNYAYDPDRIEANHMDYRRRGRVVTSSGVSRLLG